ncbi:FecR family protein [Reichenbachiella sp.]|uniref:FecR family protein n=1 Tax=Reichenbachiella sp. TaxID=2184521 RepID=UPI003BB1AE03
MTLRKNDIEILHQLTSEVSSGPEEINRDWSLLSEILSTSAKWQVASTKTPDITALLERATTEAQIQKSEANRYGLVAASIAILIMVCISLVRLNSTIEIVVPLAGMKTVWLPDSSKIILNAGATLSYPKNDWDRSVYLQGLAYLEVRKGSRFTVSTDQGEVEVLGTSFNVSALGQQFVVECITGKVAVTSSDDENPVILTPGFKTYKDHNSGLLIPDRFDVNHSKEWVAGVFNFRNRPMSQVWDEFERQFNIKVNYNATAERFYTGTFKNDDMTNALVNICKPMNMRFEIDQINKIVTISE